MEIQTVESHIVQKKDIYYWLKQIGKGKSNVTANLNPGNGYHADICLGTGLLGKLAQTKRHG
jgi:hypothetical protein